MKQIKKILNSKADILIEIIVASVFVTVAATFMLSSVLYGKQLSNKSKHISQTTYFASQVIDELKIKEYEDSKLSNGLHDCTELGVSLPVEIRNRQCSATYTVNEIDKDELKQVVVTVSWNEAEDVLYVKTATLIPNI